MPGARGAALKRALAEIDLLRGMLAAQGVEVVPDMPPAFLGLTAHQRTLAGALLRVHPRALSRVALLNCLPARDHAKAEDRCDTQVRAVVSEIRRKLGPDSIETVWGEGYRLGPGLQQKAAACPRPS